MAIAWDVIVEIAFSTTPSDPSPVWVDITQYVRPAQQEISIERGRPDAFSETAPSRCSILLDNSDGRFTVGNTASPYYPGVRKGRRIRVSTRYPATSGTVYRRFDGFVDGWPQDWPAVIPTYSLASITCTDRLARMGRIGELRSMVEEEILADGPAAYYTLGEPSGAVSAGNSSPISQSLLRVQQVGTGGTVTFGDSTGPATDDLTAALFTPADISNGKRLTSALNGVDAYNVSGDGITLLCFFNTITVAQRVMVSLADSTGAGPRIGTAPTTGDLEFREVDENNNDVETHGFAANVNDGATHFAALTYQYHSGFGIDYAFYRDQDAPITGTTINFNLGPYTNVYVGGNTGKMWLGSVAHVAVFNRPLSPGEIADIAEAGLAGFAGEGSGARIERIARYAGITSVAAEAGMTTNLIGQQTSGAAPLALMRDVETTESGLLFVDTTGQLVFQGRDHRYGPTAALTLSITSGNVAQGLSFALDDLNLVNDLSVSRDNGPTIRAINQVSIDEYDLYRQAMSVLTADDDEMQGFADWRVGLYSDPQPRCSSVPIDLHANLSLIPTLAALELSDMVTVTGLPANAPATSINLFVEGYTETLGATTWSMVLNTSPGSAGSVWVLGDATYSVLGTTTRLAY